MVETIWRMKIISWDNVSIYPNVWPKTNSRISEIYYTDFASYFEHYYMDFTLHFN